MDAGRVARRRGGFGVRKSDANVAHAKRRPRLSIEQILAACRLYDHHLTKWQGTDAALDRLRARVPELDAPSVLLKVAAVNTLYGTNLYAFQRMAEHIVEVLAAWGRSRYAPEIVERIANLPPNSADGKRRVHVSFAAKFAHFFLDAETFPILDRFARESLALHVGRPASRYAGRGAYGRFVEEFARLRTAAAWPGAGRELDRYLWLSGLLRVWRANPKGPINAEVRALFENPPAGSHGDLACLEGR